MRTATLQHCNSECRVGACFSYAERPQSRRSQHYNKMRQFDQEKKSKKISKTFVNRNGNVVTLHRESVKGQKTKGKRQRLAATKQVRCESVVNPL